jgi:hypothetical protein
MRAGMERLAGPSVIREWSDRVSDLKLSQPDAHSCQAACLGMALNDRGITGIRAALRARGAAGDPLVMRSYVKERGVPYEYIPNASLEILLRNLAAGCLCITHGWFTQSGHVIVIDGARVIAKGGALRAPSPVSDLESEIASLRPQDVQFSVLDPWDEFSGPLWRFLATGRLYDGHYSARMIWAACVRGEHVKGAARAYSSGATDMRERNMWLHVFLPPPPSPDGRTIVNRWGG